MWIMLLLIPTLPPHTSSHLLLHPLQLLRDSLPRPLQGMDPDRVRGRRGTVGAPGGVHRVGVMQQRDEKLSSRLCTGNGGRVWPSVWNCAVWTETGG